MKVSMEEKKAEAIKRMKMLKLFPEVIRQFEQDGLVNISEPPFGAHFWLSDEDKKRVTEFEQENNALVYTAIRSYTDIGQMDSFLFVSDYPEEWDLDRRDIKDKQTLAWVYNHDMPDCSEMGCIGIAPTPAAGLRRTW